MPISMFPLSVHGHGNQSSEVGQKQYFLFFTPPRPPSRAKTIPAVYIARTATVIYNISFH